VHAHLVYIEHFKLGSPSQRWIRASPMASAGGIGFGVPRLARLGLLSCPRACVARFTSASTMVTLWFEVEGTQPALRSHTPSCPFCLVLMRAFALHFTDDDASTNVILHPGFACPCERRG
jgi:hypothetical protein